MAQFATVDDVAATWRPLTDRETPVATTLIDHAHTLLYRHVPDLDDLIAAGELSTDLAKLAVVQMVVRVLRNPDAVRTEAIDGDSHSITYARDASIELIQFTEAERNLLRTPIARRQPKGVRSVRVRPGLW